jgi:hypothetical protein
LVSVLEQDLAAVVGEDHVTKAQLAKAIGRSTRTLDNWHRAHIGPPRIKFGAVILYNLSSFRKWLAAQELAPGAKAKPQRSRGARQLAPPRKNPRKTRAAAVAAE